MKKMNLKYGLAALLGLGLSANVSADGHITCDTITFTPEAFASYEFIDKACLEMVERGGVPNDRARADITVIDGRTYEASADTVEQAFQRLF